MDRIYFLHGASETYRIIDKTNCLEVRCYRQKELLFGQLPLSHGASFIQSYSPHHVIIIKFCLEPFMHECFKLYASLLPLRCKPRADWARGATLAACLQHPAGSRRLCCRMIMQLFYQYHWQMHLKVPHY